MDAPVMTKLSIRPLPESDLRVADQVLREAFDAQTGLKNFFGDRDYMGTRWRADSARAIAAEANERLRSVCTDCGSRAPGSGSECRLSRGLSHPHGARIPGSSG